MRDGKSALCSMLLLVCLWPCSSSYRCCRRFPSGLVTVLALGSYLDAGNRRIARRASRAGAIAEELSEDSKDEV